jgi:hypothetical protein
MVILEGSDLLLWQEENRRANKKRGIRIKQLVLKKIE